MLVAVSLTLLQGVSEQGFVNLDFEEATIAPTPPGGSVFPADPAQCFPGWTVGGSDAVVMYNDLSFGAPAVELMGPNFPNGVNYAPLQGSYSTALYYFNGSPYLPPTLSQTALIPSDAASINFLVGNGQSDAAISINGSNISLVAVPGGRLAGDVSAFAGTVATLTVSVARNRMGDNFLYFDDIQFSPTAVPEPGTMKLLFPAAICIFHFCRQIKESVRSPEPMPIGAFVMDMGRKPAAV